jgi:hypothetical protein
MVIGGEVPAKLSAYYVSDFQTVESLTTKLLANDFEILSTTEILKGKTVISITSPELQNTNTFVAVINILVNEKDEEIRVQNPSYFAAAYLQGHFKYGQFSSTLKALKSALGDMYQVKDMVEYSSLKNYHLMFGMPYFLDTVRLARGHELNKLIDENKEILYSLKLPNGNTLVGHKMSLKTNSFLNKIEVANNAQLLPYQSMIKKRKAYMLNPKFYIALSLPLLEMIDFMKITNTPSDIVSSLKKDYQY